MSDGDSFKSATEIESTVKAIQDILEKISSLELNAPFYLSSEIESSVKVIQDCLKLSKKCFELAKKLERLESYEKNGNVTKIMLLLIEYGSANKFKKEIKNVMRKFRTRLEDVKHYLNKIDTILIAESYKCPQCLGSGRITKTTYIRERGALPQTVLKRIDCDYCNGKGEITIDLETKESLAIFCAQSKRIEEVMHNFFEK